MGHKWSNLAYLSFQFTAIKNNEVPVVFALFIEVIGYRKQKIGVFGQMCEAILQYKLL